jgi:hypothetical protein
MKYLFLFFSFILILLFSCNEKKDNDPNIPDAFQETKDISDWSSLKRGYSNIVDQLYDDLCKKDDELKKIEEGIKAAIENDRIKTEKLRLFFSDNENYYQTALSMAEQMTDSIMKMEVIQKLNNDRDQFLNVHMSSKLYLDHLQRKSEELNNLHISLKIKQTMPEIRKYQSSFRSDSTLLNQVIKEYDSIVQSIQAKINE